MTDAYYAEYKERIEKELVSDLLDELESGAVAAYRTAKYSREVSLLKEEITKRNHCLLDANRECVELLEGLLDALNTATGGGSDSLLVVKQAEAFLGYNG